MPRIHRPLKDKKVPARVVISEFFSLAKLNKSRVCQLVQSFQRHPERPQRSITVLLVKILEIPEIKKAGRILFSVLAWEQQRNRILGGILAAEDEGQWLLSPALKS